MARAANITVHNFNKLGKKLDNERMIRTFKKKLEKSNLLQDLRSHDYYLSPSVKRRLKSKMVRQRVERENAKKQEHFNSNKFDK